MCFVVQGGTGGAGDKEDPAAVAVSKAKVKVKSADLPIVAKNIRQLDSEVLCNFVQFEVSLSKRSF